jgi:hypothetical protein
MKKYFEHVMQQETHERRNHAMQISGILTVLLFVGWLATLGWRIMTPAPATNDNTQAASVIGGTMPAPDNTLQVQQ